MGSAENLTCINLAIRMETSRNHSDGVSRTYELHF